MLKTFVMMLGEIDYVNFMTAIKDSDLTLFVQILVYSGFVFFLIVMPIIVMNLLLGLAVGDIENIRCIAGTNDLKTKALSNLAFQYQLPLWLQRKMLAARSSDFNLTGNTAAKVKIKCISPVGKYFQHLATDHETFCRDGSLNIYV